MKLMGRDITSDKLMAWVGERLAARGLTSTPSAGVTLEGVEARVDPLSFNVQALDENADATRGLPIETHRDGLSGRVVTIAKRVFRRAGQVFINEALGRQTVFNGHVRDSYAQLSAEVMRLRARVAELEAQQSAPVPAPKPVAAPKPIAAPKPPPPPPPPAAAKPATSKPKPVAEKLPKKPAARTVEKSAPVPSSRPSAPRPPPRVTRRGK
ncbi:MAG: hypothetical protein U0228_29860 [Myxococcaceae bacterium]